MDEEEALASVVFRVKGQCSDAGVEIVREYVQERLGSSIDYCRLWKDLGETVERVSGERDSAVAFLKKASFYGLEIVSTARLTELQISNFREAGCMYVEPGGGLGWVVRRSAPPQWQTDQEKELDSLRAALATMKAERDRWKAEWKECADVAEDEIGKLRAALAEAQKDRDTAHAEAERLHEVIERLRAQLDCDGEINCYGF